MSDHLSTLKKLIFTSAELFSTRSIPNVLYPACFQGAKRLPSPLPISTINPEVIFSLRSSNIH